MAFAALYSLAQWSERFGTSGLQTVLTVGNFDGLHLGHQKILRGVVARARGCGALPAAVTFDPHPLKILRPTEAPPLIAPLAQRLAGLKQMGLDAALVLTFDLAFSRISPEEFVRRILVEQLHTRDILVGENFRFGHQQAGDLKLLAELGSKLGFSVEIVAPVVIRGEVVSSTAIRQAVRVGQMARAARLLGGPFSLTGEIRTGSGQGTRLVVPTLNLAYEQELVPKTGVYATETLLAACRHRSVTNVGMRPTFAGSQLTVESHLFDFRERLTSGPMEIHFWRRLRDEHKFTSPEALREQVQRDVERARAFFRRLDRAARAPLPRV